MYKFVHSKTYKFVYSARVYKFVHSGRYCAYTMYSIEHIIMLANYLLAFVQAYTRLQEFKTSTEVFLLLATARAKSVKR